MKDWSEQRWHDVWKARWCNKYWYDIIPLLSFQLKLKWKHCTNYISSTELIKCKFFSVLLKLFQHMYIPAHNMLKMPFLCHKDENKVECNVHWSYKTLILLNENVKFFRCLVICWRCSNNDWYQKDQLLGKWSQLFHW